MSKRSTVTMREQPVAAVTAASGPLHVQAQTLKIETTTRLELQDLTDRVMALVRAGGVREGVAHLTSLHTTCTVFVNESQPALLTDFRTFLEHVVAGDHDWKHNDPEHSDCDRQNADAHLRALLLSPSVSLQVSGGEVVLGRWQRILMAELDGPRPRTFRLQVMGVA